MEERNYVEKLEAQYVCGVRCLAAAIRAGGDDGDGDGENGDENIDLDM